MCILLNNTVYTSELHSVYFWITHALKVFLKGIMKKYFQKTFYFTFHYNLENLCEILLIILCRSIPSLCSVYIFFAWSHLVCYFMHCYFFKQILLYVTVRLCYKKLKSIENRKDCVYSCLVILRSNIQISIVILRFVVCLLWTGRNHLFI